MAKLDKVIEIIKKNIEEDKNLFESEVLTGFSGKKLQGLLQRLAKELIDENNTYVEVGVFQGLSLLNVSKSIEDKHEVFGIDNFAYFDSDNKNKGIVNKRIEKLNCKNVKLIDKDYELALENLEKEIGNKKISLFFIDGPHDYRSQLMCLLLAKKHLSDEAIILIDDSNYKHVRQANRDFLVSHKNYKLIFETYSETHPHNLNGKDQEKVKNEWWDGLNVIYYNKNMEFPQLDLPLNDRDRTLYENEHIIHPFKYSLQIPKYLTLIKNIESNRFLKSFYHYSKLLFSKKNKNNLKYVYKNMHSEDLPKEKIHA